MLIPLVLVDEMRDTVQPLDLQLRGLRQQPLRVQKLQQEALDTCWGHVAVTINWITFSIEQEQITKSWNNDLCVDVICE
jgi:uncharacterized Zn finger protein